VTTSTQLSPGQALEGLAVLADPVRRQLLVHLVDRDLCTCGDLVEELGVGQPTVSHHLKVLREAGLVCERREGTRRLYRAEQQAIADLRRFLEDYWDDGLDRLRTAAEQAERDKRAATP
jgi:DNA-binding transcriptional ArsR family regulator